jgi:hypothetical protein
LLDQLMTDASAAFETSIKRSADELRAEITTRLADIDQRVGRAVADALPGLRDGILADARGEFTSAIDRSAAQTLAAAERQVTDREAVIRSELGTQIAAVRGEIAPAVTTELDRTLPSRLAPLQKELSALNTRTTALEQRSVTLEQGNIQLAQRTDTLDASLKTNIAEVTQLQTSLGNFQTQMRQSIDAVRTDLTAEIDRRARAIAQEEAKILTEQLRRDVEVLIQNRTTAIAAELTDRVKTEFASESARNQSLITAELDRTRQILPNLVQREFTAFEPRLNVLIDEAVRRRT